MTRLSSLLLEEAVLFVGLVVDAVSIRSISLGDAGFSGGLVCGVLGSLSAPEPFFFCTPESAFSIAFSIAFSVPACTLLMLTIGCGRSCRYR